MCGRFTLHLARLAELRARFAVERDQITDWAPRYNIAPTQPAPVVLQRDVRTLEALRFGFVSRSASGPGAPRLLINARVETVATLPSFRQAFRARRCIVPATGYFEWAAIAGLAAKQPFWIRSQQSELMALAGVFEPAASGGSGQAGFAIVTTEAEGALRELHPRMPLELVGPAIERWLAPQVLEHDELLAMVTAARDVAHLHAQPVDRCVNSAEHDDPQCIAPPGSTPEDERQLGLFDP